MTMSDKSFLSTLKLTSSAKNGRSAVNLLLPHTEVFLPGVYNRGMFTLFDEGEVSSGLLANWSWILPPTSSPIAATGFGDLFFLDRDGCVCFLEVQAAQVELVDRDVAWVLNEFLAKPSILKKVLRLECFDEVVRSRRSLNYGETFVLSPWEVLGGERRADAYDIGSLDTYLDLVGQTLCQVLNCPARTVRT